MRLDAVPPIVRSVPLVVAAFALSACGGGGGSGSDEPGMPPAFGDDSSPVGGPAGEAPVDEAPVDGPVDATLPDEGPPDEGSPNEGPAGEGPVGEGPTDAMPPDGGATGGEPMTVLPPDAGTASYEVTLRSLWLVEDYPQDFPDGETDSAHLSFIGGATHNAAVSFWEPGEPVSPGVEDVAQTGRIEIFLEEDVRPAIANGTADSTIAIREFTFSSPYTIGIGLPTERRFDLAVDREWPLVSLLTMLGPSPDWFVGVNALPLHENGAWRDSVTLDLPLYDGGTKSGTSPFMGGPSLAVPEPVRLIAYDPASGTYGPSDAPQTLARIVFTRTR